MSGPVFPSQPNQEPARHTATPWSNSSQYLYGGPLESPLPIASGKKEWATDNGGPCHAEAVANAAFIVEAVNSHASLKARVEELTDFVAFFTAYFDNLPPGTQLVLPADKVARARAALEPTAEPVRRCKHDVSEDCPACAEETIAGLKAALLAIKAKTEGNRPTVNEQNAFEHFAELNARLVEIRALSRAALTGTRDLARGPAKP